MFVATESEVVADRLEADVAAAAGLWHVACAQVVKVLASVLETEAWQGGGIRSIQQWAMLHCGVSSAHAHQLVAMARGLGERPHTAERFTAGALSGDQVKVIVSAAPAHVDAEVAELASTLSVPQLSRALRRYNWTPVDQADPEVEEERRVRFGSTETGGWSLHALLPADEGAVVETVLRTMQDRLFRANGAEHPDEVTWADAFLAMADAAATADGAGRAHRDRYVTLVHLEVPAGGATPVARLHMGSILPDSLRRYVTCDATMRPVTEIGGVPVNVGRAQHIVPDRTRRLIEHRDGGCRVPGCASRVVQVHHVIHWEDKGPTDTANLCALCPAHHRMHHHGRLGITGNADHPDGLTFSDHRGRPLNRAGPAPPSPDTPRPTGAWNHPTGETLSRHDLHFNEPPAA